MRVGSSSDARLVLTPRTVTYLNAGGKVGDLLRAVSSLAARNGECVEACDADFGQEVTCDKCE